MELTPKLIRELLSDKSIDHYCLVEAAIKSLEMKAKTKQFIEVTQTVTRSWILERSKYSDIETISRKLKQEGVEPLPERNEKKEQLFWLADVRRVKDFEDL